MVVRACVGCVLILPALPPHPHNAFVVFVQAFTCSAARPCVAS